MKLLFFNLILSFIATNLCYSMTPDEQLFYAVVSSNLQQVHKALRNGAHINAHYVIKSTPL